MNNTQRERIEVNLERDSFEVETNTDSDTRDSRTIVDYLTDLSHLLPGNPELAKCLDRVSNLLGERYRSRKDPKDLEDALRYEMAAVDGTPEGDIALPVYYQNLVIFYGEKYRTAGNMQDLDAALKYGLNAAAATPEGHPSLPGQHWNLSVLYGDKYSRVGNLQDLDTVLKYSLAAVAATPEGHPCLPDWHRSLGTSYNSRYKRTGDLEDLEAELKYGLASVATTPVGHPDLAYQHYNLAVAYEERYKKIWSPHDLGVALKHDLAAVAATPEGHPGLPARQQRLAVSYGNRYKRTGDLQDLNTALKYSLAAVIVTPEGHPDLPTWQLNLAVNYRSKYRRTGELQDLEAALKYDHAALAETPAEHPDVSVWHLSLAASYRDRHGRTGDLQDLETAIKHNLMAVATVPQGHPYFCDSHHSLAISYLNRYKMMGDPEDLESALKHSQGAVAATPQGHPDLPYEYECLAASYRARYERTGSMSDLEGALQYNLAVVVETPEGHPALPHRHQSLAITYEHRYRRTRSLQDLDAALKYSLAAVVATPEDHPDLPWWYSSLAVCYNDRYRITRNLEDLEAQLKFFGKAVAGSPDGHPNLPWRQALLAQSYLERSKRNAAHLEDLSTALNLYQLALQSPTATPQDIWDIAVLLTMNKHILSSQQILWACEIAQNILPSLLWLGNSIGVRHDILVRHAIPVFMSVAVTTALQHSDTELATLFFEQALSMTHQQMFQLRLGHTDLETQLPAEAKKLQLLSAQLQGPSHLSNDSVNYHLLAHQRLQLIAEIREHPQFEDFLLPPKYSNLCLAAKSGPVILLNYTDTTIDPIIVDAIIILSPSVSPVHLHLTKVFPADLTEQLDMMKNALNQFCIHTRNIRYGRPHQFHPVACDALLESVIYWTWAAVVEPIFEVLYQHGIYEGRLWWCPSGPFTYLPLHAAAPLESKFIQSYTPTLGALIQANSKQASSDARDILTAVGVVKTSEKQKIKTELPFINQELDSVISSFGHLSKDLRDTEATLDNVVKEIQSSPWVHIASHGVQDLDDPLKSGLILYDGKLELGAILDLNLPNAKFVYLSACETAMGDAKLMNEAMHLAGGFLSAGFQGAIGTLWSMSDAYGPKVAEVVYKTILGEDKVPDVRMAAEGLHLAIQKLRTDGVPHHQWMPFIHLGI